MKTSYSSKNPIPQEKFNKFYDKINKLATKEFDTDEDGDLPIQIKLIDRTRYEYLYAHPLPYMSYKDKNNSDILRERLLTTKLNLFNAKEQIDITSYDIDKFLKEKHNKQ